ncbi:MAG: carbamoyltransferase HypF [Bacteroidota bacterium]
MTNPPKHIISKQIKITGLVQGVGFRPFIYRLAHQYQLNGWVENRNDCVLIEVESDGENVNNFIKDIPLKAPLASSIHHIEVLDIKGNDPKGFSIKKSESKSNEVTEISPDIAVCQDCLDDMSVQAHRIDYPFINCTNCGPRFSIIKDLPYDREKTTMMVFPMCNTCKDEYTTILDRRFHAQPVACNKCGPHYRLVVKGKEIKKLTNILFELSSLIEQGKIIAVKGIGGFHIMCDAFNEKAVSNLRAVKIREGKPFAVMFRDVQVLGQYVSANKKEIEELQSWRRPMLLLKNKKQLAKSVSLGLKTTGCMIPYMPFHYQLFEKLKTFAVVLTSGNFSDEPIILNNKDAAEKLESKVDAILDYNREIFNRTDDSVGLVVNRKLRMLRRSRGFAPSPVRLNLNVEGVFATGAELVNCFCIGKGKQALLSQHIGDLKNWETYQFYTETYKRFKIMFRFKPELVVTDMHPDYLSTKFGDELAVENNIPVFRVQHHHAHIASTMAQYGLDEKVIGLSFDGTGYGTDGNIWGAEFMICDLLDFKRYSHFEYIPLPGGDKVTKEPWRIAVSYLYKIYGFDFLNLKLKFLDNINPDHIKLVLLAIDKSFNTPLSSSAGRLFDAVSAISGICVNSTFHAEAPMRLENIISEGIDHKYPYVKENEQFQFSQTIINVVNDLLNGVHESIIAAKFHNTIISLIFDEVVHISKQSGIKKIVFSGGTFQNKYIVEGLEKKLELIKRLSIYFPTSIPANDGGIALGQIAVAGKRRSLNRI